MLLSVIGECIGLDLKKDIREAARLLQIATNFSVQYQSFKIQIKETLEDKDTEAVILVDASGPCGSSNRGEALYKT